MRKTGLGFTLFGAVFGVLLFFVRRTQWYLAESASNLSETAEFIESAFWACLITFAVGIILLLLSLRRPAQPAAEEAEYDEAFYEEPPAAAYAEEAAPIAYDTQPPKFEDPWRPDPPESVWKRPAGLDGATVRVPEVPKEKPQETWLCDICGCENPPFSNLCAVCGSARGSAL